MELLPLLKTFFCNFSLKISFSSSLQITQEDQLHFFSCPSKLDFWGDFKVRQTGNMAQDKVTKGTNK